MLLWIFCFFFVTSQPDVKKASHPTEYLMDSITEYLQIHLPVHNPTAVFSIVLAIILFAPLIFSKLRIPHLVGMILAGVLIGENGLNILRRDESFRLFGQVGIFYIMFLAGLEMDLAGLRQNKKGGLTFGLLTALIPFGLGYVAGAYVLHYTPSASWLLACIFASHTLVAYPIVTRYGVARHKSVQMSVVGTMIALLFALIVLAGISGTFNGEGGWAFWSLFAGKFILFIFFLFALLPKIIRLFFRKISDQVLQFTFVVAIMFLAAAVADLCGLEGILGAFLSGLVFNRYIPQSSPLMNRVEFVGNALFIPFFLIGVGMLVNITPIFKSTQPLIVVIVMVVAGTLSKYLAALISRRLLSLSKASGLMMFGLSEAHAAGALAMVIVGTSLTFPDGTPLMDSAVLDGVVVMILISCIISSVATEQASKLLKMDKDEERAGESDGSDDEKILIPLNEIDTIPGLVSTAIMMRNPRLNRGLICLNIVNDDQNREEWMRHGRECLEMAEKICASADVKIQAQRRLAVNFINGTLHAFHENDASEIIIGRHRKRSSNDTLTGRFADGLIHGLMRQVTIVHYTQPVNTIRRIVVAVPLKAEYESGFYRWVERIARMAGEIGCGIHFHASDNTLGLIEAYMRRYHKGKAAKYFGFSMSGGIGQLAGLVNPDHLLVIVTARNGTVSFSSNVNKMQGALNKHFPTTSIMIIYPDQSGTDEEHRSFADPLQKDVFRTSAINEWMSKWIGKIG